LALGYLVSALFPALENHMTQIYFGDLATLTNFDAKLTLSIGLAAVLVSVLFWKALARQSFELATFGEGFLTRVARRERALFSLGALVLVCFSVQLVGFLFTVTALFLPTTLLTFLGRGGLRLHLSLSAALGGVGALAGFLASLQYTRLPTVPSIVLGIAGLGAGVLLVSALMRRINASSR
jgi:ABC-type Mn2+/Zn2+ transport system permease subunit